MSSSLSAIQIQEVYKVLYDPVSFFSNPYNLEKRITSLSKELLPVVLEQEIFLRGRCFLPDWLGKIVDIEMSPKQRDLFNPLLKQVVVSALGLNSSSIRQLLTSLLSAIADNLEERESLQILDMAMGLETSASRMDFVISVSRLLAAFIQDKSKIIKEIKNIPKDEMGEVVALASRLINAQSSVHDWYPGNLLHKIVYLAKEERREVVRLVELVSDNLDTGDRLEILIVITHISKHEREEVVRLASKFITSQTASLTRHQLIELVKSIEKTKRKEITELASKFIVSEEHPARYVKILSVVAAIAQNEGQGQDLFHRLDMYDEVAQKIDIWGYLSLLYPIEESLMEQSLWIPVLHALKDEVKHNLRLKMVELLIKYPSLENRTLLLGLWPFIRQHGQDVPFHDVLFNLNFEGEVGEWHFMKIKRNDFALKYFQAHYPALTRQFLTD